jgi:hypothetical protein
VLRHHSTQWVAHARPHLYRPTVASPAPSYGLKANHCWAAAGRVAAASVKLPSQRAAPVLSFRPARTRGHGWRAFRALRLGAKLPASPEALAARSRAPLSAASFGCPCRAMAGAATTDEAWLKQRCGALSRSVSASWRATSTGRWPSVRSEPQSLTALQRSTRQTLNAWDESVKGRGNSPSAGFMQKSWSNQRLQLIQRRNSVLGWKSPVAFERKAA